MVLELLAAVVGAVLLPHHHRPDTPCHPADDRILRIKTVREEIGKVRRKVIDMHAARQVVFHKGEAVGEGEGKLADGVGARPRRCGSR